MAASHGIIFCEWYSQDLDHRRACCVPFGLARTDRMVAFKVLLWRFFSAMFVMDTSFRKTVVPCCSHFSQSCASLPAVMCKCQVRSRLFGLEWKRICNLCTPACKWYQKFIGRAEAVFFIKLSVNAVKLTILWCMLQSAEHCLSLVYLCDSHWSKVCVSFELSPSGTYVKLCSPLCEAHCMFFLVFFF